MELGYLTHIVFRVLMKRGEYDDKDAKIDLRGTMRTKAFTNELVRSRPHPTDDAHPRLGAHVDRDQRPTSTKYRVTRPFDTSC